jgi:hypothetical protein
LPRQTRAHWLAFIDFLLLVPLPYITRSGNSGLLNAFKLDLPHTRDVAPVRDSGVARVHVSWRIYTDLLSVSYFSTTLNCPSKSPTSFSNQVLKVSFKMHFPTPLLALLFLTSLTTAKDPGPCSRASLRCKTAGEVKCGTRKSHPTSLPIQTKTSCR